MKSYFNYLFLNGEVVLPKISRKDITSFKGNKNFTPSNINNVRLVSRTSVATTNGCSRRGHGII